MDYSLLGYLSIIDQQSAQSGLLTNQADQQPSQLPSTIHTWMVNNIEYTLLLRIISHLSHNEFTHQFWTNLFRDHWSIRAL